MKCNFVRCMAALLTCGAFLTGPSGEALAQANRSLSDAGSATPGGYVTDDFSGIATASYFDTYESDSCGCESAADQCCATNICCLPRNYVRAEYLAWWIKGNNTPPLLTTSPTGTPRDDAGVLPGATILVGNERLDNDVRHGARFTIGHWFDNCQTFGVEFSALGLSGDNTHITRTSTGDPILARPFFNVAIGQQDAQLVAFPNVVEGAINIDTTSEFYSGSLLLRQHWRSGSRGRIDLLGGYRYARFREGLSITETLRSTDPGGLQPVGTLFDLRDSFVGETDFHGGELGIAAEFYHGPLTLYLLTKLAIGGVRQVVEVDGQTVITDPVTGPEPPTNSGLLALPSNSGTFSKSDFALLPEVNLTAAYQLTSCLSLTFGYNLLYLTEVVRTGDQIDPVLDLTQLPPAGGAAGPQTRPTPRFNSTSMWAQGANVGLQLSF